MRIVVVGLGHVGLPIAIVLSQHYSVTAVDNNMEIINQVKNRNNKYFEHPQIDLKKLKLDVQKASIYRFSKYGINFYYDENLINYHMEHARNKKDMIAEMQRNITYFYEKYNCSTDIKFYWDYFRGEISLEETIFI